MINMPMFDADSIVIRSKSEPPPIHQVDTCNLIHSDVASHQDQIEYGDASLYLHQQTRPHNEMKQLINISIDKENERFSQSNIYHLFVSVRGKEKQDIDLQCCSHQ